jgi:hypothetical protein
MVLTTNWADARRFATAVQGAGGELPPALANLLTSFEVLAAPGPVQRPEDPILTHALAGTLDAKTLAKLAPAAASAAATRTYLAELARSSEHVLLGEWNRQLAAGGADQVLSSLRERFNRIAEEIAGARALISPDATAEMVIETGRPELVGAWQTLGGHVKAIARIAAVACQFGPRIGNFPQIREFTQGEGSRLTDQAILCTDGDLMADSALFGRPDPLGHRDSPWFRVGALRLHSIESAQERYNRWAADEFDRVHAGDPGGWIDESGRVHPHAKPVNPFRKAKASA